MQPSLKSLFLVFSFGLISFATNAQTKRIDHPDGRYDVVEQKAGEIYVNHYNEDGSHAGGVMFYANETTFEKVVEGLIYDDYYEPLPKRKKRARYKQQVQEHAERLEPGNSR